MFCVEKKSFGNPGSFRPFKYGWKFTESHIYWPPHLVIYVKKMHFHWYYFLHIPLPTLCVQSIKKQVVFEPKQISVPKLNKWVANRKVYSSGGSRISQVGAPAQEAAVPIYYLTKSLLKTAWKWKKLDRDGRYYDFWPLWHASTYIALDGMFGKV